MNEDKIMIDRIMREIANMKNDLKCLKEHHDHTTHSRIVRIANKTYIVSTTFKANEDGWSEVKGGEKLSG